jgi:hypothetical protein
MPINWGDGGTGRAAAVSLTVEGHAMSEADPKREQLARLEERLAELKSTLPEHCSGSGTYVDYHRASVTHWREIEDAEGQIPQLRAELGL